MADFDWAGHPGLNFSKQRVVMTKDGPELQDVSLEVQNLDKIKSIFQRVGTAQSLAFQGEIIWVPVDVWDWDGTKNMRNAANYGYPWVPSALIPQPPCPPGVHVPGLPDWPTEPPIGAILVPPKTYFA